MTPSMLSEMPSARPSALSTEMISVLIKKIQKSPEVNPISESSGCHDLYVQYRVVKMRSRKVCFHDGIDRSFVQ